MLAIQVKDENANDLALHVRSWGDLSLNTSKHLRGDALTAYIGRKGLRLGYRLRPTMYSIGRRTATDLVRTIGTEATRDIISHDPASRMLADLKKWCFC